MKDLIRDYIEISEDLIERLIDRGHFSCYDYPVIKSIIDEKDEVLKRVKDVIDKEISNQ